MKKLFYLVIVVLVAANCSTPMSKESYLKKFDNFISEISGNHKTYDENTWQKMTEKYEKFSGEWYDKFKDDFTLREHITIKANQGKWYYYRFLGGTVSVKELLESLDIKGIKEQLQYYIDNNMQDDLQKIYEEAKNIGEGALKAITEILEELEVNIEELKNIE